MKTFFSKSIFLGLLFTPVVFAQSFTTAIPEGAYRGKFREPESGRAHFFTQNIKGCEGCFIAVIFKDQRHDKRVDAYKAVPTKIQPLSNPNARKNEDANIISSPEYDLIPLGVDTDGEITTPNENPSLVLTVQRNIGTSFVEFQIMNANGKNAAGTQSALVFTGGASHFDRDTGKEGRYKKPMKVKSQGSINIFSVNSNDGSRSASATLYGDKAKNENGIFNLEEKAPGVFTFSAVSHLATGSEVSATPQKLVIFMKRFGRERAYLIDPSNSSNVSLLKGMN